MGRILLSEVSESCGEDADQTLSYKWPIDVKCLFMKESH